VRCPLIFRALRDWLQTTLTQVSRKSALAEAIRYALARWEALTRYGGDGCLEIDNNAAERALRAIALGRKNYLFAGSDAGGERAAIYTLIGTAKLNGFDPEAYLRAVLTRIADHPVNRVDELLPWNLRASSAPPDTPSPLRAASRRYASGAYERYSHWTQACRSGLQYYLREVFFVRLREGLRIAASLQSWPLQ
jgi:hypothetical protein